MDRRRQFREQFLVGVQLYFVDSSTVFTNLSVNNNSGDGTGADGAGVSVRSSYFAAKFDGLKFQIQEPQVCLQLAVEQFKEMIGIFTIIQKKDFISKVQRR